MEKIKECLDTDTGADYTGTHSTAVSGATCMYWHDAGNSTDLQPLPENFCRNPDGRSSPWCFTSQGVVEFCSIEKCRKFEMLGLWYMHSVTCMLNLQQLIFKWDCMWMYNRSNHHRSKYSFMHVYVSFTGETTDNGTLNPLTPGTGEKVKTGDSGQTDGVTEANKVTEGSPFKTSMDRKLCLRANYLPNNWCK